MNAQIFKCFIASPGDTQQEREICDEVFNKINQTIGETFNFRIESVKWEKNARPSFGKDGQDVINKQLLVNYQLFIGLMWNRFGAPTQRAESGTEEEFLHAFDRFSNKNDEVEILFYFNKQKASIDSLDLEQAQKVKNFKNKVSGLGGLYHVYDGHAEFGKVLYRHLFSFFNSKFQKGSTVDGKSNSELGKFNSNDSNRVREIFSLRLENALINFEGQPTCWLDPIICPANRFYKNINDTESSKIDPLSLIQEPRSIVIKSPPRFGLTCLSHFLCKSAWEKEKFWLYLDARKIKRNSILKSVSQELKELDLEKVQPDCLILDSWNIHEHGAVRQLKNLCIEYPNIPIVVMRTISNSDFLNKTESRIDEREFLFYDLLALPKNKMRKLVKAYIKEIPIGDEDCVLNKMVTDLDALNIHRTASNCFTLLKVCEKHFDESPVNRTKMLEMVLFILFDFGEIPTYKTKPDIKNCEYVLGKFCETLIRERRNDFTREEFLKKLGDYCAQKLMYLDLSLVFDTLFKNKIIIPYGFSFNFSASYWIYYFSAKRMYVDENFRDYIIKERNYISFPEIIEFYTGIDRNRDDALVLLTTDLSETIKEVDAKLGLEINTNIFKNIKWNPTSESIDKMTENIKEEVLDSRLPESVKDTFSDRTYNINKPYDQSLQSIFEDFSLKKMWKEVVASSRALRNSEHADTDAKRRIFHEITRGWEQLSKVLLALSPILAVKGQAAFEGQSFHLTEGFDGDFQEKLKSILIENPYNVVEYFKEDISSNKIGPLLEDKLNREDNDLIKHMIILLLIANRPPNWHNPVKKYMTKLSFNSFFLFDIVRHLRGIYDYSYTSEGDLRKIRMLMRLGLAKKKNKEKNPTLSVRNQIHIPKRDVAES